MRQATASGPAQIAAGSTAARNIDTGAPLHALVLAAAAAVLSAKRNAATNWLASQGVKLTTGRGRAYRASGAYHRGTADGANASLSHSRQRRIGGAS